jgi:hypothetical protein
MRVIKLITIAVALLVSTPYCRPQCSGNTHGKRGNTLEIRPTDGLGLRLDEEVYVKKFVDLRSNTDRARLFGVDPKFPDPRFPFFAKHMPYGRYRIELQARSGSEAFGRVIDYCQKDEAVEVPNHSARVHIVLLDESLNSVEAADPGGVKVIHFTYNDDDTEMASLFKGAAADQVPYGHYELEFLVPLGYIDRQVDVLQPDVWVYSDDAIYNFGDTGASDGPENVVRGELRNIPDNQRPVFLTMSGVNVPYMIDSAVTDTGGGNGTFSFLGLNPMSVYMLYTIGKSGILDAREVKIPRESEIVIDLAHPSPPKIDDAP